MGLSQVVLKKKFSGRKKALTLCMTLVLHVDTVLAQEDPQNLEFDESLFLGTKFASGLNQLNKEDSVTPGNFDAVDVLINNKLYKRTTIQFIKNADSPEVFPCLSDEFLTAAGIELANKSNTTPKEPNAAEGESIPAESTATTPSAAEKCIPLAERVKGASFHFDQAKLRLELSIPQALLQQRPRGYIERSEWEEGEKLAFVNYSANFYRSDTQTQQNSTSDYGFVGLKSGLNLGLWQLRQQSNLSYSSNNNSSDTQWNNIRTYVQRPISQLDSELTLGETFTDSTLFGTMSFRGVKMATDQRMWPESMRGFAPEVRGVATSNARVIISQNGREIYETNVAPGPFVINDLYSTTSQGDLNVEVIEANGSRSTFTVPFSAVPDSMRPGVSRYNAVVGESRDFTNIDSYFTDFTYERGLTNQLTANSGIRLAQDYTALLVGGVIGTSVGAFGLNTTYSHAKVEDNQTQDGWRMQATYSQTFNETGTSFSLAGYRYSTKGYRDLNDVFGVRSVQKNGGTWDSSTYKQRSQFTTTINQTLAGYGQLSASASTSDYYNDTQRDTQLQLNYSNSYKDISYNVALSRQRTIYTSTQFGWDVDDTDETMTTTRYGNTENIASLTVSIPLNIGSRNQYLSMSANRNPKSGNNYQTSLSGTAGERNTLNYSVNAGYDDSNVSGSSNSWGANVQKQFPNATVNGSYSRGNNYTQYGAGARGAAVIHSKGVTLGPYLGDTFGLIEADGAQGATVRNAQGARIDKNGFALVPSLTPYNYNTVGLDTKGINRNTELKENQGRVVPYAGAAVRVKFETLTGYAVLIQTQTADGEGLPLGSDVYNNKDELVGMVGQGNQIYARVKENKGSLYVRWGENSNEQCELPYDFASQDTEQDIIHLTGSCRR
ncbi:fimbria/pilus outer membrane usher protein [Yersinia enterocolitica]|uniref:fimbria/pilus outer membrane usher protein n=1 Tax=Yersinia enterocolitica TaxID=630 RepID=UPI0005DDF535|nr:fimbria/pilus outer membrane usher protein [Yersinia enterocolitica]EKN3981705.1 fimbria/pilus outer membrane usher protein [Yersinia enterocolitica]EKN3986953.1 fimbria/pilus outer membrane usher protein [Yersinia enterocolitica]EKN5940464.1 fimbrial biogenesis outer membrane usher protein [Yersinia enterocolitica]EKN6224236.1 fimbrial biogenesis outer membrane usher protein [Yersinia enterocolitica]ELI8406196.1 fimbria/pilus outer membrane usher protein [Yersinia enterocolitica]